jgi:hypothetical protein
MQDYVQLSSVQTVTVISESSLLIVKKVLCHHDQTPVYRRRNIPLDKSVR